MKNVLPAVCLSLAALAPVAPAAPTASPALPPATYDCEGEDRASVTLAWDEEAQSFRAQNSTPRSVRVEVETFAGKSSVTVGPQKSEYLSVKGFNGPYRATFE